MAETKLKDFPSIFSLTGRTILITGGSRGLGLHAASGCLQAGAKTVFITSRKASACQSAVSALNALPNLPSGSKAISVPADVSAPRGIASLLEQVKFHTDYLDVLVCNAGATWGESFDSHPASALDKVLALNVNSVFLLVQAFAPLLEASPTNPGRKRSVEDPSRVIVTASIAGIVPGTLGPQATYGYSASKAAAIHLVKNLALDLGTQRRWIRVNAIAPGFFPSKMSNGLLEMGGGVEKLARRNPSGRLGKGEDFAAAVVYLASRAAEHVHGATLVLDGGSSMACHLGGEFESPTEGRESDKPDMIEKIKSKL